ncbi:DUF1385 domain-containing protein [Caldisalinibacter kiritimatiensis]|uniref:DUF1385 domain-containing protein n=1 Tax=Caldisalinibacter kiritimatiensis TaxID=1304284 RepID=R1AX32_9FIRM|nr:DUF1385 domain-containing protein [Caldisalinibacter kiritimatiensis]EOD01768.1 hypothetical protein L21TH_0157 [Caldisalinibacter kiritimatiensis]
MSKIKDVIRKPKHITSIGGQALIEGVMMKGPKHIAIAVRKPDGDIELKKQKLSTWSTKYKFLKIPFIRGSVALIEAMVIGVKSLMYSAEFYEEEEDIEPSKFDKFLEKIFKDKTEDVMIYFSVFLSLLIAIGAFMLGPSFLANFLKTKINNSLILNLIEGFIRISIFLLYVYVVSRMDDIYRVFQYHGAEHKSIHCYEHGEELTVENARKYTTLHPRCGTSFLFNVMIISILVFSLFGWPNPLMRFISRIVMLPVIAGISYEINKVVGKSDSMIARIISYPGLMLQKLTTNEPDDSQLEVGLEALKAVLVEDKEADSW